MALFEAQSGAVVPDIAGPAVQPDGNHQSSRLAAAHGLLDQRLARAEIGMHQQQPVVDGRLLETAFAIAGIALAAHPFGRVGFL